MLPILFLWTLVLVGDYSEARCKWESEVLSISSFSSDPNKVDIQLRTKRKGREGLVIHGFVDVKYDTDATTKVEGSGYISESGHPDDYKLLPYRIEKQPFDEAYHEFYEELFYKSLKHCSDLPKYDKHFKSPFPQNSYTFTDCVSKCDGKPEILAAGYYKLILNVTGEVNWGYTRISKLTAL